MAILLQRLPCCETTGQRLTFIFLYSGKGEDSGDGAGCIKSPDDGTCGCENSDGTFVYGSDSCK